MTLLKMLYVSRLAPYGNVLSLRRVI